MPYSSTSGKSVIRTILSRLDKLAYKGAPLRGLDIGAGSGTYPKLVRELMSSKINWTGIEIWEPYVKQFELDKLYDNLILESADSALEKLCSEAKSYDLIFVGDVLEHMTRETAVNVLSARLVSA